MHNNCDKGHPEAARTIVEGLPRIIQRRGGVTDKVDITADQFVDLLAQVMCGHHEAGRLEALREVDVWLPIVMEQVGEPA